LFRYVIIVLVVVAAAVAFVVVVVVVVVVMVVRALLNFSRVLFYQRLWQIESPLLVINTYALQQMEK